MKLQSHIQNMIAGQESHSQILNYGHDQDMSKQYLTKVWKPKSIKFIKRDQ